MEARPLQRPAAAARGAACFSSATRWISTEKSTRTADEWAIDRVLMDRAAKWAAAEAAGDESCSNLTHRRIQRRRIVSTVATTRWEESKADRSILRGIERTTARTERSGRRWRRVNRAGARCSARSVRRAATRTRRTCRCAFLARTRRSTRTTRSADISMRTAPTNAMKDSAERTV